MDIEKIREYCIAKPMTEEGFPFNDSTLVMKVCGKMYAVMPLNAPNIVILKCEPTYADELKEHYSAIDAAWHFNKKHWIQITFNRDAHDRLILDLIDHSYKEVIKKLPKRLQQKFSVLF